MIVVRVELWPGGREDRKREIGRMTITNRGDGSRDRANYDVRVMRRGTTTRVQRTGEVLGHARRSYSVWRLVLRALQSAVGAGREPAEVIGESADGSEGS